MPRNKVYCVGYSYGSSEIITEMLERKLSIVRQKDVILICFSITSTRYKDCFVI